MKHLLNNATEGFAKPCVTLDSQKKIYYYKLTVEDTPDNPNDTPDNSDDNEILANWPELTHVVYADGTEADYPSDTNDFFQFNVRNFADGDSIIVPELDQENLPVSIKLGKNVHSWKINPALVGETERENTAIITQFNLYIPPTDISLGEVSAESFCFASMGEASVYVYDEAQIDTIIQYCESPSVYAEELPNGMKIYLNDEYYTTIEGSEAKY